MKVFKLKYVLIISIVYSIITYFLCAPFTSLYVKLRDDTWIAESFTGLDFVITYFLFVEVLPVIAYILTSICIFLKRKNKIAFFISTVFTLLFAFYYFYIFY